MNLGTAFSDHIKAEKPSHRNLTDHGDFFSKAPAFRSALLLLCLFSFGAILLTRLFFLQIVNGGKYRALSNNNRTKTEVIHAPRGIIFDRNATPLVFNVPGFRKKVGDKVQLLSKEEAIRMLTEKNNGLEIDALRQYPYKDAFAHVIGYIGQISQEELSESKFQEYKPGDVLGKMGIEKEYEKKLKGIDGKKLVEVDSHGSVVRTLGETDPTAGEDITLTLDAKLQVASFLAMKDIKKGAVIVSAPQGEILSLVSKPSFDPNIFTMGKAYKASPPAEQGEAARVATDAAYTGVLQILSDSTNQPLLNRAISGTYPPGSTFKLVVASAGLEQKTINEQFEITDTGILKVGEFSFANWYYTDYGKTDGVLNVVKAIKRSNDIFFYKLAEIVGIENLSLFAKKFGLGQTLGIDLEGEAKGLVPDTLWKKKTVGEDWYLGDTYHLGIGQGYLSTTPLQVNAWTQVIANGGTLYQPHLLKGTRRESAQSRSAKFLNDKTISLVRQGMVESCSPGGVAWPLFKLKIKNEKLKIDGKNFLEIPESSSSADLKSYREIVVACKTGTAEHGGQDLLPHAWITLFAPAYDPQIVVTVLAESSGEGSNIAAPIAKKILEEWFGRN